MHVPATGRANGQEPPGAPSADTALVDAPQGAPAAGEGDGVEQPVLPRSMRPFYHVFAAFGVAWLLIFAYAISVRRRLATLEDEVDRLTR